MLHQPRHMTASALVIDPHKMLTLLIKHRRTGYWQAPGGHIEPGEAPHDTAVREVREETGIDTTLWSTTSLIALGAVWLPQPLMVCQLDAPPEPHRDVLAHQHVDFLYLAMADSSRPLTPQVVEVDGARWWPFGQLNRDGVRGDMPAALDCALGLIQPAPTGGLR